MSISNFIGLSQIFVKVLIIVFVAIAYYLMTNLGQYVDVHLGIDKEAVEFFKTFHQSDLLIGLAGVVVTIVSVSMPIALSAISDHLKDYNDKIVCDYFINEPTFSFQVNYFAPMITIFTLMILFGTKSISLLGIVIVIFIWSLFRFRSFIKIIVECLTNTDELIIKKYKQMSKPISKKIDYSRKN